jgi:IclR family mhp operon transcriptional activator
MATKLENRSLDRALTILEVLASEAPCTLHQLHERTRLPKSTIRRLLGTLKERHFVRQGISDGLYSANVALPWAADREFTAIAARLVGVALPHMSRLTETVQWPSNLLIQRSGRMSVIESTRSLGPFGLDAVRKVERDVSIFASAAGRAYLASLKDAEIMSLVRSQQDDPHWGLSRFGIGEKALLREVADIRKQGWAPRRPGYATRPISTKFIAIAVSIGDGRRPIGAVTLFWPRRYLAIEPFARQYADELKATAAAISADLANLS